MGIEEEAALNHLTAATLAMAVAVEKQHTDNSSTAVQNVRFQYEDWLDYILRPREERR